ncbi:helix-turn-helix domain-containing protein [Desulfofalx alkaliphila]|uniref:helix-turn-helix domain-containing protein n=1 Tax=Desulfofalx alkaliphila TaxID=105483 RepID=UPI0004E1BB35|nr:helix-turn-helix domain-containing protein [Desulfofalx alkaliphila]
MDVGNRLRESRLAQGYSLEQVEEATKIRSKYIEALENEEYHLLPGEVYVVAFMRNYAKYLGLDDEELVQQYRAQQSPPTPEISQEDYTEKPKRRKRREIRRKPRKGKPRTLSYVIVASIIFLAVIAFAAMNSDKSSKPDTAQQPGVGQEDRLPDTDIGEQDDNDGLDGNLPNEDPDQPQQVELVLSVVEDRCWMNIEVDGQTEFSGIASAGEIKEFIGQERIYIELGNAGVVEVQLNGENLGTLAPRNHVYRTEFTVQQG